jgi:hypothetical protein
LLSSVERNKSGREPYNSSMVSAQWSRAYATLLVPENEVAVKLGNSRKSDGSWPASEEFETERFATTERGVQRRRKVSLKS